MNPEQVFEKFTDQGGFRDIPVVQGAIEMLQDIRNRGYWIQLLTARPKENLKCLYDTYFWLNSNNIPVELADKKITNQSQLADLVTEGTYFLSCLMTYAQIEDMREKKVMFEDIK